MRGKGTDLSSRIDEGSQPFDVKIPRTCLCHGPTQPTSVSDLQPRGNKQGYVRTLLEQVDLRKWLSKALVVR